jgi:hypothetical protein
MSTALARGLGCQHAQAGTTQRCATRPSLARRRTPCVAVRASAPVGGDQPAAASRRALLGLSAGMAAGALLLGAPGLLAPHARAEPFLASTGGKGILAAEEEKLYNLRLEKEGEVGEGRGAGKAKGVLSAPPGGARLHAWPRGCPAVRRRHLPCQHTRHNTAPHNTTHTTHTRTAPHQVRREIERERAAAEKEAARSQVRSATFSCARPLRARRRRAPRSVTPAGACGARRRVAAGRARRPSTPCQHQHFTGSTCPPTHARARPRRCARAAGRQAVRHALRH